MADLVDGCKQDIPILWIYQYILLQSNKKYLLQLFTNSDKTIICILYKLYLHTFQI
jgi:hypothetical protein